MDIQTILREDTDASAIAHLIKQGKLTETELRATLVERDELLIQYVNKYLETK